MYQLKTTMGILLFVTHSLSWWRCPGEQQIEMSSCRKMCFTVVCAFRIMMHASPDGSFKPNMAKHATDSLVLQTAMYVTVM